MDHESCERTRKPRKPFALFVPFRMFRGPILRAWVSAPGFSRAVGLPKPRIGSGLCHRQNRELSPLLGYVPKSGRFFGRIGVRQDKSRTIKYRLAWTAPETGAVSIICGL